MNYLYHWVPKNMRGDVLYPLNILKEKYPDLYAAHVIKYTGRDELLNLTIPSLHCLWNDVLHFTLIHPKYVKAAMQEAGDKRTLKIMCYEIDPHLLNPKNTIVYLYKESPPEDLKSIENLASYNPDKLEQYASLPEETKQYYKETYAEGKNPLAFHKSVHILYKGSINVEGIPIIEV